MALIHSSSIFAWCVCRLLLHPLYSWMYRQIAGDSQRSSAAPSVLPRGTTLLRVSSSGQEDAFVLGDTRAQREAEKRAWGGLGGGVEGWGGGLHPSNPALIPPLKGPRRGPLLSASPRLVPAWIAGDRAWHDGTPTWHSAEWGYWRGDRLALSVPDGDPPPRPPTSACCSLFSLPLLTNQRQSPVSYLSNTNCQCVVDLREWQEPLLGNLYPKGELMLSVLLFFVRIRPWFSPLSPLWVMGLMALA